MTRRKSARFWNCRCECGREIVVSESDLLSGRVTSCGGCDDGGATNQPSASEAEIKAGKARQIRRPGAAA